MNTKLFSTILFVSALCGVLVVLGYVSGANDAKKRPAVLVDARPGVEFEVKPARNGEPMTIVCRLDDGEHNVGEVTR